ncbi:HTH domain-containing protein [Mesorhizobium sp. CA14]|uniref:HTH domain-containing protein n=1 Tax=Mesorhizobium sp. CA14 TaxID=2876642 RepID=UPI001CCF5EBA|nr:HTH domain-containing protein [Mesorhizobium sp. CA14]MBZ9851538.1 HTH domain-containing protein [Mesorhizobium sp. CA14]
MATKKQLERQPSYKEQVYEALATRDAYPVDELAGELGVSQATVEVRIEELQRMNVPVFCGNIEGERMYVIPCGPPSLKEFVLSLMD